MKRQEIEKLMNIFQRSEKTKREIFKNKLIEILNKSHLTIEEMERVDEVLKLF